MCGGVRSAAARPSDGRGRAFGDSRLPASGIVEAQWIAERRGFEPLRSEQPPYSILDRGIEREILPVTERYGMGVLVWSPLAQGLLTGRVRKGQATDLRRTTMFLNPALRRREATSGAAI